MAIHEYKTYNRKVKFCRILLLHKLGVNCGEETNAVSFKGEKYFVDLYNQYKNDIKPNIKEKLKKFNVSYIVKDKNEGKMLMPEEILGTELVWKNDRFEIYTINY